MRLATIRRDDSEGIAIVHGAQDRLFDVRAATARNGNADAAFASMLALIDGGPSALDRLRDLFEHRGSDEDLSCDLDAATLLAPLQRPRQMRDGMSFPLHIRQSPVGMRKLLAASDPQAVARIEAEPLAELPEVYRKLPIYYLTNRMIVGAPGSTVHWPRYSRVMDYELEFGIVTTQTAANIKTADAGRHIFGFTLFNDFSARDQQAMEMPGWLGPAKGKSFDGGNVIGPWIVTPDELADPYALKMSVAINGETIASGTTEGMLFSFEEILVHMSQDETVHAGEFIGSGTVGNCCGLENGRFLEDGDTIELVGEGLGTLRNRVVRQAD